MRLIKSRITPKVELTILVVLLCASPALGQCDPNWKPGNGLPNIGLSGGTIGIPKAFTIYNEDLIIGGSFLMAGGIYCAGIAR
jgi:hypothetical protein